MLFKLALVLLVLWVLGLFGVYQIGDIFHGFLLVGLTLLLLGFLQARDAAARRAVEGTKRSS